MEKLRDAMGPGNNTPRPCDIFDLIGDTSTGGQGQMIPGLAYLADQLSSTGSQARLGSDKSESSAD